LLDPSLTPHARATARLLIGAPRKTTSDADMPEIGPRSGDKCPGDFTQTRASVTSPECHVFTNGDAFITTEGEKSRFTSPAEKPTAAPNYTSFFALIDRCLHPCSIATQPDNPGRLYPKPFV